MKYKWLLVATIIVMLASMLAACGGGQTAKTDCSKDPTPPPLAKKDKYKVGFSQVETNNPWQPNSGMSWSIPMPEVPKPSRLPTSNP